MVINYLIRLIEITEQLLVLLIIASAILSYFMPPYHQVRQMIDRIVEPMLTPIRRVIPLVGSLDFSPLVLIILIQITASVLISLLYALR